MVRKLGLIDRGNIFALSTPFFRQKTSFAPREKGKLHVVSDN